MKVLMVNGSPKSKGNTAAALSEVGAALEGHGIEWEVFQLGAAPVRDCIGCGKCSELDCACVFDDDMVNELIKAAQQADGFVFGTPVYYAHPTGRILSVLDRAFYAGGAAFEHKPGAAIAVARRGGITASFDVLNKYFTIKQMPVVASTYWNGVHGHVPGEAALDEEGMRTMRNIGHNMAWMLKCIEFGRENGIEPVFMALPAPSSEQQQADMNSVQRLADELDVPFLNLFDEDTGIDFYTDCYDYLGHMNPDGASKLTHFVGQWLTEHYALDDRRGDDAYSAWNEKLAQYEAYRAENWENSEFVQSVGS